VLTAILLAAALAGGAGEAIRLYQERQFAAAEREFRRHLAARPGDASARLYLARTLIETNRVSEGLGEIQRALAGQPSSETRFQAGNILRELAERRFSRLEATAPESPAVRELAGNRLELQGRLTEALREYRAVAEREASRPGIHFRIGNVLWKHRELDEAAKELRAELSRSEHHALANLRLGQVLIALNREAEAAPYLERAVAVMPESADARRELGKAYRKMGRTADARREWEQVAKARPEDGQIHFLLGGLYRELGETALASRELELHRRMLERRRALAEKR